MSESKVALIGSGGAYLSGQVAFHWKDDTGIRRIPTSEPATDIRVTPSMTSVRCASLAPSPTVARGSDTRG